MSTGFTLPFPDQQPRQDRRRPKDQCAVLRGELRMRGIAWPAVLEDSPALGLIITMDPPPLGEAELWVENFGCIPVHVTYAGENFAGLTVGNPSVHRDRLMLWFRRCWPVDAPRDAPLFLAVADRRQRPS